MRVGAVRRYQAQAPNSYTVADYLPGNEVAHRRCGAACSARARGTATGFCRSMRVARSTKSSASMRLLFVAASLYAHLPG